MRKLICLLLMMMATSAAAAAVRTPAASVHRPNLDLSIYRRMYTTDEAVSLRLSSFNLHAVQFSVYRFDIDSVVPTSKATDDLGKPLALVDLGRTPRVRSFTFKVGKTYPDNWTEQEVKTKGLPAGCYLVAARGGGVEKRTWLLVSDVALVGKRSRQALVVWAVDARSGAPLAGAGLRTTDAAGAHLTGQTGDNGLCTLPAAPAAGPVWIHADWHGQPAVLLSGAPDGPPPYTVFVQTDRPVYRPANVVSYKAVVRRRVPDNGPGGFRYETYAGKPVTVEIRDSTDALIARKTLTTNAYGSVTGDLKLASEPVLGDWQIVTVLPLPGRALSSTRSHSSRSHMTFDRLVGSPSGSALATDDFCSYASFTVEAYRKPDFVVTVAADREHYVGGETVPFKIQAKYYAGQPVPQMRHMGTQCGLRAGGRFPAPQRSGDPGRRYAPIAIDQK